MPAVIDSAATTDEKVKDACQGQLSAKKTVFVLPKIAWHV